MFEGKENKRARTIGIGVKNDGSIDIMGDMSIEDMEDIMDMLPEPIAKKLRREMIRNQINDLKAMMSAEVIANLFRANNSVTTLEIKTELRTQYPEMYWSQNYVSDLMAAGVGGDEPMFTFTDNGTYRTYSLVGKAAEALTKDREPRGESCGDSSCGCDEKTPTNPAVGMKNVDVVTTAGTTYTNCSIYREVGGEFRAKENVDNGRYVRFTRENATVLQ